MYNPKNSVAHDAAVVVPLGVPPSEIDHSAFVVRLIPHGPGTAHCGSCGAGHILWVSLITPVAATVKRGEHQTCVAKPESLLGQHTLLGPAQRASLARGPRRLPSGGCWGGLIHTRTSAGLRGDSGALVEGGADTIACGEVSPLPAADIEGHHPSDTTNIGRGESAAALLGWCAQALIWGIGPYLKPMGLAGFTSERAALSPPATPSLLEQQEEEM
ncbi:hypothetical protein NDU88_004608 [Pleurodeles waltl]|uniref:Uncharacterized protein n=1 Tax=Pleurodeles waltl TaxID=8319 RepID=A0AAV7V3H9_PLEWA|nr:hypothetical protein NDU88_004608 [Pleurodeles waltl]